MSNKNNEIDDDEEFDNNDEQIDFEESIDDIVDVSDIDEDIINDEIKIEDDKLENEEFDILFKNNSNKHKLEGKHSLERDTIFKGKLEEPDEIEQDSSTFDNYDI